MPTIYRNPTKNGDDIFFGATEDEAVLKRDKRAVNPVTYNDGSENRYYQVTDNGATISRIAQYTDVGAMRDPGASPIWSITNVEGATGTADSLLVNTPSSSSILLSATQLNGEVSATINGLEIYKASSSNQIFVTYNDGANRETTSAILGSDNQITDARFYNIGTTQYREYDASRYHDSTSVDAGDIPAQVINGISTTLQTSTSSNAITSQTATTDKSSTPPAISSTTYTHTNTATTSTTGTESSTTTSTPGTESSTATDTSTTSQTIAATGSKTTAAAEQSSSPIVTATQQVPGSSPSADTNTTTTSAPGTESSTATDTSTTSQTIAATGSETTAAAEQSSSPIVTATGQVPSTNNATTGTAGAESSTATSSPGQDSSPTVTATQQAPGSSPSADTNTTITSTPGQGSSTTTDTSTTSQTIAATGSETTTAAEQSSSPTVTATGQVPSSTNIATTNTIEQDDSYSGNDDSAIEFNTTKPTTKQNVNPSSTTTTTSFLDPTLTANGGVSNPVIGNNNQSNAGVITGYAAGAVGFIALAALIYKTISNRKKNNDNDVNKFASNSPVSEAGGYDLVRKKINSGWDDITDKKTGIRFRQLDDTVTHQVYKDLADDIRRKSDANKKIDNSSAEKIISLATHICTYNLDFAKERTGEVVYDEFIKENEKISQDDTLRKTFIVAYETAKEECKKTKETQTWGQYYGWTAQDTPNKDEIEKSIKEMIFDDSNQISTDKINQKFNRINIGNDHTKIDMDSGVGSSTASNSPGSPRRIPGAGYNETDHLVTQQDQTHVNGTVPQDKSKPPSPVTRSTSSSSLSSQNSMDGGMARGGSGGPPPPKKQNLIESDNTQETTV